MYCYGAAASDIIRLGCMRQLGSPAADCGVNFPGINGPEREGVGLINGPLEQNAGAKVNYQNKGKRCMYVLEKIRATLQSLSHQRLQKS